MKRALDKINLIVLHCSASDRPAHDDISVIRKWHVEERGWSDVGYHYFIKRDGTIQVGRMLDVIGAHVAGHNRYSIGICLHGNGEYTEEQFKSAGRLVAGLQIALLFTKIEIKGHCDLDKKKSYCPGFDRDEFINKYVRTNF